MCLRNRLCVIGAKRLTDLCFSIRQSIALLCSGCPAYKNSWVCQFQVKLKKKTYSHVICHVNCDVNKFDHTPDAKSHDLFIQ